ncbi:hypothetical protein PPL_01519 [Heterostelium album PN500]|uniref:G8 domain-containing protein n=1 Tax=Heterostelium pallidum (strain ATCC 26659 / Pp 5 / PN500) TaxID=670386 RepID=D3AZH7_HETP5|nr:hypothetical protein PPL_01519 [Heterostelium album PN500]EFA85560.1 hypothetical protein PPL_01519 [Heterostelium album PN500]|eukprot:XP_020437668.1 hypothetical protein PPL_01519 [Heterostelium album PN500]
MNFSCSLGTIYPSPVMMKSSNPLLPASIIDLEWNILCKDGNLLDTRTLALVDDILITKYSFQYDSSLTTPKVTFTLLSSSNAFGDLISSPTTSEVLIGSGQKIEATIRAPINYQFNSITFQAYSKASIDINGLKSNIIDIQGCTTDISSPIKLTNLISNQLTICSKSSVTISGFQFSATTGNININSDQNVELSFLYPYVGSISGSTSSSLTPVINGLCSLNAPVVANNKKTIQGTCGSGGSSSVQVTGLTGVNIVSPTSSGSCPTLSTWRDPEPSFAAPTSPAIPNNIPQFTINYPANIASFAMLSTYRSDTSSISNGSGNNVGGVSVANALRAKFGGPSEFHVASIRGNKFFRAGQTYQFNFKSLLGQAPTSSIPFVGFNLCIYDGLEVDANRIYLELNPSELVACYPVSGSLTSTTSWTNFQVSFTIPTTKDIVKGSIGLHVKFTYVYPNDQIFFLKDLDLVIPSRSTTTPPTLLTSDSELVTLRKPPTTLTPQNRANCPHLQNDLVHWHDPSTWGGAVPSPSSVITLPANKKVLISSCSISDSSVIFNKIIVPPTSELIFSDSPIQLNIKDLYVQGKLLIGSKDCRIHSNIQITFHGARTTTDTIATGLGSKGIAVASSGFISIQGKQYKSTWTRLAATAYPDESIIYVQDSINWEVGQKVLITSSRYHNDAQEETENEVLTIAAIQGKVIQFTTPVQFYHYAGLEYQAEVALLSRRISIRGASDSDTESFGGHILTMGNGQFSGLELTKMGQLNMRGRYPLHFHLANHVTNSYISDCSVYNSYYRCYTIHGTHDLLLTENVAYNVKGHCYYIEDGIEENNTISYNLASKVATVGPGAAGSGQGGETFVESETLRQPADSSSSGFYITNAYNRIIGNSASSAWASYAFVKLPNSVGAFKDQVFDPSSRPNLEFDGNTAHSIVSTFYFGACVYVGGKLYYEPGDSRLYYMSGRDERETTDVNGNPVWMKFTNTKSYLCSDGISHWGNRVDIEKYESHDNHRSATVFGSSSIRFALVNGRTPNTMHPWRLNSLHMVQGFQFYDTWTQTILTDVNFRNFIRNPYYNDQTDYPQYQDNRIFVSMTHSTYYKPQGISVVRNITYSGGQPTSQIIGHTVQETDSSRYFNLIDSDGTATQRSGTPTIVGSHLDWWRFDNTCQFQSDWRTWYCNKGSREIGNIDLLVPGLIDQWALNDNIVGYSHLFGPNIPSTPRRSSIVSGNAGITGVTGIGWYVYFTTLGGPSSFDIHTRMIPYGQYIILALKYPAGTTFTGRTTYEWSTPQQRSVLSSVSNFASVLNGNGNQYYFDGNHLYLKLVNQMLTGNQAEEQFQRGGARLFNIFTGFRYHVIATCPSNNCQSADTMPNKWV